MNTYPDRHTKHITIGVDPVLTYRVLSGIIKRRNHVPMWKRITRKFRKSTKHPLSDYPL